MHGFDLFRLWRRAGGSKAALAITLCALLLGAVFGTGALFITRAANQSALHGNQHKPGHPSKKDEGTWFQLSHFGKSHPAPDARAKALKQAQQLPTSLLGSVPATTTRVAASSSNLATMGGGWVPLGPVGEDSSTCPSYCNNYGVNSGRITAEAVNPTNSNDIWVGAADGGLWHSTDGGAHWTSVSDSSTVNGGAWPTLSIGAIAIDPTLPSTSPSTIYVGTGESNLNGDAYWGAGVFKSTDGGASWTQYGASQFGGLGFAKLAVDPFHHNTVLAAVGYNGSTAPSGSGVPVANMGIWQSADGGQTWTQVLHNIGDGPNGFDAGTDIVFDPAHPNEVFAGLANSLGAPSSRFSSGAGVWYSANSGAGWSKLSIGIPTGNDIERVSLGISSDGTHVYAALTDGDTRDYPSEPYFGNLLNSAIYASTNNGQLWSPVSISGVSGMADDDGGHQWWYDSYVAVDPTNANTVYVGGVDIWQTQAGATSTSSNWTNLTNVYGASPVGPHPDQHALAFLPSSSKYYIGNDGGVWIGTNAGVFTNRNTGGLNITQFYQGSIGEIGGVAELYGGAQDNGELQYPGASVTGSAQWNEAYGGDGGDTAVDYTNNHIIYEEYVNGQIHKSTDGGATWNAATTGINICTSGCDPVNFIAPFAMSQGNSATLVMGTDKVYLTTNSAASWTAISPTLDNPCAGSGSCIQPLSAVAIAPSNSAYVYAGSNYGDMFASTNGGTSWHETSYQSFSPTGIPTGIAVDPTNPAVAYVAFNSFVSGTGKHLYKTTNGGTSWADVSASLPNVPFEAAAIDPTNHNLVVVGSDAGVFISQDAGSTWANLGIGLPNAAINQIFFDHTGGRLFVATHGRGMWERPLPLFAANPGAVNVAAAAPGTNPGPATFSLSNAGFMPLNWTLSSSLPSWIASVSPTSGTLNPGQSQVLTVTFNLAGSAQGTQQTQLTFSDPHAANNGFQVPVTAVEASVSKTWYFAEGYTAPGYDTYLTIANPNPTQANVSVQYLLLTGSPVTKPYQVPANARYTIHVNDEKLSDPSVSMVVTSDQPIVVERPMYFIDYSTGYAVPGGTDTLGATSLSQDFSFGYLDTSPKHSTFLTILNQNNTAMTVTTEYSPAAGGTEIETTNSVAAHARGTIYVNQDHGLAAGVYSARVHLSASGLVERPLYFIDSVTGNTGAADVIGVPAPQTSWYFAEGWTDPTFSERYLLSNPCLAQAAGGCAATKTATVSVQFMDLNGTITTVPVTLTAGQQQVINVNSLLGNYASNSATITSDHPVLAERLMSFRYTGQTGPSQPGANYPGATDVLGAAAPTHLLYFAEGYTDYNFAEYLTLQNPDPSNGTWVTITYLPLVGSPVTTQYYIGPHTRATVFTNQVVVHYSINTSFSLQVESTLPIVAERPMYFSRNYGAEPGATDVVGYQPPGS